MTRFKPLRLLLATSLALALSACSLVVDFDRSLLLDAGVDAGPDAASDAGDEEVVDAN